MPAAGSGTDNWTEASGVEVDGAAAAGGAGSEAGDAAVAVSAGGASDCGLRVEGGEGESGAYGCGGDRNDGGATLVSLFSAQSAGTDADGAAAARWG